MAPAAPEVRFVRALAAGILREGDGAAVAARAALRDFLSTEKNLVLEVQFTGFARRGEQVGGVHPLFLRSAAQLIVLRVNRIGFTAEAAEDDLRALFDAVSRPSAELPEDGVVGLLRERSPRGIFLSTSSGEVYRPERSADPEPAVAAPAPETVPPAAGSPAPDPGALDFVSADSIVGFDEFEFVETAGNPLPPAGAGEERGAGAAPPPAAPDEPPADDLYHFFRAATPDRSGPEAADLAGSLRSATTVMRFDELTQQSVAAVPRLLDSGDVMRAVELVEALVEESRRADRSRLFRDSAQQALRRAVTDPVLARLAELLERGGEVRGRVLRVLLAVGGGAFALLEGIAVRTGDAGLREAIFRAMLGTDPGNNRILERALGEPVAARTRAVLELAMLPGIDATLTRRWLERGAGHPDASVREDVVRHATRVGGRGGMRILVDLLADADESVRRAAVRGLGELAEPAAVPFLARIVNDSGDDELQLEAVAALGRTGSAEALPVLAGVLARRQLFSGKRLQRLKLAAVAAVARIPIPAAREVLASLAAGKDAELAAEARRSLDVHG